MDRILKIISCLFLLGILVVQIIILQRMPPTLNEISKAKGEARQKLELKQPVIRADVVGPLEVENTIGGALQVYVK